MAQVDFQHIIWRFLMAQQQQQEQEEVIPRYVTEVRPDGSVRLRRVVRGASITQQHYRDEVNVNEIVARARRGERVEHLSRAMAQYSEVEFPESFQDAANIVAKGKSAFESLPARLRERFDNDPVQFMQFMVDEESIDEARELGLIPPAPAEALAPPDAAPSGTRSAPDAGGSAGPPASADSE